MGVTAGLLPAPAGSKYSRVCSCSTRCSKNSLPLVVEVAPRPYVEHRLRPFHRPPHPGLFHPVLHQVTACPLRRAPLPIGAPAARYLSRTSCAPCCSPGIPAPSGPPGDAGRSASLSSIAAWSAANHVRRPGPAVGPGAAAPRTPSTSSLPSLWKQWATAPEPLQHVEQVQYPRPASGKYTAWASTVPARRPAGRPPGGRARGCGPSTRRSTGRTAPPWPSPAARPRASRVNSAHTCLCCGRGRSLAFSSRSTSSSMMSSLPALELPLNAVHCSHTGHPLLVRLLSLGPAVMPRFGTVLLSGRAHRQLPLPLGR